MGDNIKSELDVIKEANQSVLDYFNDAFLSDLENIQDLKTQIFEIDIKIDELQKTKDLYALKSGSKKSAFTPIITDNEDTSRSKLIDDKVNDLNDVRDLLTAKLINLESSLSILKKRLATLNNAQDAINSLSLQYAQKATEDLAANDSLPASHRQHGYNILMLDAFDKTYLSTVINRNLKENVINTNHKLEMLSYLLGTDISRAKLMLKEMTKTSNRVLEYIDDINASLSYKVDSSKPIFTQLEDFVLLKREEHPEFIITSNFDYDNYEIILHPVIAINLVKLLEIFFDNAFIHSKGNTLDFNISIKDSVIDVSIKDNGVGIKSDYLSSSPWYSSLHKVVETMYLLNATYNICNEEKGVLVTFSIPTEI